MPATETASVEAKEAPSASAALGSPIALPAPAGEASRMLALQRTAGNRAAARLATGGSGRTLARCPSGRCGCGGSCGQDELTEAAQLRARNAARALARSALADGSGRSESALASAVLARRRVDSPTPAATGVRMLQREADHGCGVCKTAQVSGGRAHAIIQANAHLASGGLCTGEACFNIDLAATK